MATLDVLGWEESRGCNNRGDEIEGDFFFVN